MSSHKYFPLQWFQQDVEHTTNPIMTFLSIIESVVKEERLQSHLQYVLNSTLISTLRIYIPYFNKEYYFENGIVQMIFEKLAVQRNKGIPLYIFWDKKCLRVGQDWEQGFLRGLLTSKVIILLMSKKVLYFVHPLSSISSRFFSFLISLSPQAMENIISKASTQQDNVLLEYHQSNYTMFFFFFFEILKIWMCIDSKQDWKNTSCSSFHCRVWWNQFFKVCEVFKRFSIPNSSTFPKSFLKSNCWELVVLILSYFFLLCCSKFFSLFLLITLTVKRHQKELIWPFLIQYQQQWKKYLSPICNNMH